MKLKYYLQSIIFVIVAFILGCNEFMVVGVSSQIARSYHVSLSTVGILVTLFALTYAICPPIIMTVLGFSTTQLNFLLGMIGIMFIIGNLYAGQFQIVMV